MGYNLKSLTTDLQAKNMADEGLVAWGQAGSGSLFGAVGGAFAPMHAISKQGNKILITPFSNKQIKFNECVAINKDNIASAKVSGLFGAKLVITVKNGETRKYSITQGKDAVKKILSLLGL